MDIPIYQIAVVDRSRKDMGELGDLMASMRSRQAEGLPPQITAGVVRRATEDDVEKYGVDLAATPWVLVAGGRRYAALMLGEFPTFRADDFGTLSPLQQKICELEENLNRKNLEWPEEVFLKEEILRLRREAAEETGDEFTTNRTASQKAIAAEFKETPANLSRDLNLAKALRENPELRNAPTKAAAIRMLEFKRKVDDRLARVDGTNLSHVGQRLVTADMRDFVRSLPTHSVDLCFTDFPFGIDYKFDDHDRNKYADSVNDLEDLLADVIPEILRVTKPTGWLALMMGSTNYQYLCDLISQCCVTHFDYFDGWWEQLENGEWKWRMKAQCRSTPKDGTTCQHVAPEDPEWIWYRPNSRNPSMWPELHAQNQFEKICVVNMGKAVMIKKNLGNVLVHDAVYEDRIHEMQRPHSLCVDIVSRFTVGGERVLDLCFGSGSALAAAASLQRDFIGCDINPANLGPALGWVTEHMEKPL